jgi:hypothetical protein
MPEEDGFLNRLRKQQRRLLGESDPSISRGQSQMRTLEDNLKKIFREFKKQWDNF